MAESSRVTINIASFTTSSLTLRLTRSLASALMEEAVLLKTSIIGPVIVVSVTVRSRCRFRERPLLLLSTRAPHFLGRCSTNERVEVSPVVLTYLLLAVLSSLQWTPLTMALANKRALRSMTESAWCKLLPPTCPTLTLLQATALYRTLQKWPTRPATAAPFVFAEFIKVTPRLRPVQRETLPSIGPLGIQEKLILLKIMPFLIGSTPLLLP